MEKGGESNNREDFDKFIDFLDEYRKQDFPTAEKINKDIAFDLIGDRPELSHFRVPRDLKADLILFTGALLIGTLSWFRNFNCEFDLLTIFCLTSLAFYFGNLFLLVRRYKEIIRASNLVRNNKEYSGKFKRQQPPTKLGLIIVYIALLVIILGLVMPLIYPRIEGNTHFEYAYLVFIASNVIVSTPQFLKLESTDSYNPKDAFECLIMRHLSFVELPFWIFSVITIITFMFVNEKFWFLFVILPFVIFVKRNLDGGYLLKKLLLSYQRVCN